MNNVPQPKELWPIIGNFAIKVVLSGVVATITKVTLGLTVYEGILLTIILFLSIQMIQLEIKLTKNEYVLQQMSSTLESFANLEQTVKGLGLKTREIADGLRQVAVEYSTQNNLFVPWYNEKINELIHHIRHTLENNSFYLYPSNIREHDKMNEAFHGSDTDRFWATASCQSIAWYATPGGDLFLREMQNKFLAGKINQIKRLFIYDDESELTSFMTQLCFYLHLQSGYEYRVINRIDFEAIIKGFGDRTLVGDFGIYGNYFIWETSTESKIFIDTGYVCVDKERIVKYTGLFEKMWDQAVPYLPNSKGLEDYKNYQINNFRILYLSAVSSRQSS